MGPELVVSVQNVFKAANVPVEFEPYFLSEVNPTLSAPLEQVSNSIARNRVCLKVLSCSMLEENRSYLTILKIVIYLIGYSSDAGSLPHRRTANIEYETA